MLLTLSIWPKLRSTIYCKGDLIAQFADRQLECRGLSGKTKACSTQLSVISFQVGIGALISRDIYAEKVSKGGQVVDYAG